MNSPSTELPFNVLRKLLKDGLTDGKAAQRCTKEGKSDFVELECILGRKPLRGCMPLPMN